MRRARRQTLAGACMDSLHGPRIGGAMLRMRLVRGTPRLALRSHSAGATTASDWLLRLSASATKPEAFISSTNFFR